VDADSVAARLSLIRLHLDGRAWRWLRGAQAEVFDCGGFNGSRVAVVENRLRRRGRPGHQVCGTCGPALAISRNWRARPLHVRQVILDALKPTTTSTGLTVNAALDTTP